MKTLWDDYFFVTLSILLFIIFLVVADGPYAAPGGEGDNTGCNGQGNPNSPCAPAPNPPTLPPGKDKRQIDLDVTVNNTQPSATSNSTAQGGSSNAQSSSSSNSTSYSASHSSVVGQQTQEQNNQIAVSPEQTTNVDVNFPRNEYPSAGAADVYAAVCTSSASGQLKGGGIAIANGDPLCDQLKVAMLYYQLAMLEDKLGNFEKAMEYYELAHNAMSEAQTLLDATDEMALVDRFAGYAIRPLAILGALVWLL